MTGGSYSVPSDEHVQMRMFDAIAHDLREGVPYHINEIATPVFRMFYDLDFKVADRLTHDQVGRMARVVHDVVRRFFPENKSAFIPDFFEQIVTHSDSKQRCCSRLDLEQLTRKVNLIKGSASVTVEADGWIKVGGVRHEVAWVDEQVPLAGVYFATADESGNSVELVSAGSSLRWSFPNPQTYKEALQRMLREGNPPTGALLVEEEVRGWGPSMYNSSTVFELKDGKHFLNVERDGDGLCKHGIHVIFPQMHVDIQQALFMREALIEGLIAEYGLTHAEMAPKGWHDVVDNAVYGVKRGLRMYGASKAENCKECHGQNKDGDCPNNCQRGKIDVGRPHLLHSVYLNGVRDALREERYGRENGSVYILKRTSIRTIDANACPDWKRYDGCPGFGDVLRMTMSDTGQPLHVVQSARAIFKTDIKKGQVHAVTIEDPEIHSMFQHIIRTRFPRVYRNLRVKQVKRLENGQMYFIYIEGEGQHWCLNKMPPGDHTNNTVYFQCDQKGICVRCRSPKLTIEKRMKQMCKDYHSGSKPLDRTQLEKLFPAAKRQRAA